MIKEVKDYISAKKEYKKVRNDGCASFMDLSIRDDRMKSAKQKAIIALGKVELKKIIKELGDEQ